MTVSPSELISQLAYEGGSIVSSNECSPEEIALAQLEGRFAADAECFGYVRRVAESKSEFFMEEQDAARYKERNRPA